MSGRLLGQAEDFATRLQAARALRLPHGLLIEGAAGTGKSTAARLLAQALLCGGDAGEVIGGSCPCSRRVHTGNHADLHLVEVPEDKLEIPVERIRDLQDELARLPVEGRARVAIVDPADRLNEQGQNALLKTLEEPGPDRFLILVTARPEALSETVRSRVARLRVRPLAPEALRAALSVPPGVDPALVDDAVERAAGSLGQARALLDEEVLALDRTLQTFLAAPAVSELPAARGVLQGVSGRSAVEARARLVLGLIGGRLRIRLRRCLAEDGNGGYVPAAAERSARAIEAVLRAEQDLSAGIPPAQVLDGALLGIVDALAPGAA